MKFTVNTDKIAELVEESEQIFLAASGEKYLLQLLDLEAQVEAAIKEAKQRLAEAGSRISPKFKSIHGERIVVMYKTHGSKYKIDEAHADKLPEDLYVKEVKLKPVPKAIDAWADEHNGKLPLGIIEPKREKSIVFKLKNHD